MGGKVAMELALTYPERVANLVVVDIAPVPYDSTLMHTVYNVTAALLRPACKADWSVV